MKKAVIPFNGEKFSQSAFSFASALNNSKPILLTGIFLSQVEFSSFFLFPPSLPGGRTLLENNTDDEDVRKNIERFTSLCKTNNIACKIHEDLCDFAVPELVKETRFADLLIIGSEMFLEKISYENDYDTFLKDTLQHTECAVMVVPEKFIFPSMNLLVYDGSTSSVFAIKQFAYLFPHLCDNKTVLVYTAEETEDIPAMVNIEELASIHFSDLAITVINNERKSNLADWVLKYENPLLISGSFGRSGFSSLFTKNFVIDIIRAQKIPVFIAHQ